MSDPYRKSETRAGDRSRWLRLLVILGVIVVLMVIVMLLLGGLGGHGPGRHTGLPAMAEFWRSAATG